MESILILLSPFAQKLRNGMPNPKSPSPEWWGRLVALLPIPLLQIGVAGEPQLVGDYRQGLPLGSIADLVRQCDTWISSDSFLPHLAHHVGKPGVVVWSRSDPNVFGYPENHNLLKDRKYLRKNTFGMWEEESYMEDAFVDPAVVAAAVRVQIQKAA